MRDLPQARVGLVDGVDHGQVGVDARVEQHVAVRWVARDGAGGRARG